MQVQRHTVGLMLSWSKFTVWRHDVLAWFISRTDAETCAAPEGAFWRAQRSLTSENAVNGMPVGMHVLSQAMSALTSDMKPAANDGGCSCS